MYYLYGMLNPDSVSVKKVEVNEQLLGQNFILFLKIVNQEKVSFHRDFLESALVKQLHDYSEIITANETRGRPDPFVPYASSRPLR
jgi:hypothetical protein